MQCEEGHGKAGGRYDTFMCGGCVNHALPLTTVWVYQASALAAAKLANQPQR